MSLFTFCPSCGGTDHQFTDNKRFACNQCSYVYFHNTATACAVFIVYQNKILFTVRNQEPGFGMLDLPGGFIDSGETLENGIRREIREELGLELGRLEYFTSFPNTYPYRGTVYFTCDLFFIAEIDSLPTFIEKSEIQELVMLAPGEIILDRIAFHSIRNAVKAFVDSSLLQSKDTQATQGETR